MNSAEMLDLLSHPEHGMRRLTEPGTAQRNAIDRVVELYEKRIAGVEPTGQVWLDVYLAAKAASRVGGGTKVVGYAVAAATSAADAGYASHDEQVHAGGERIADLAGLYAEGATSEAVGLAKCANAKHGRWTWEGWQKR